MKDPVKEVFDALERTKTQPEKVQLSSVPKRAKICIILHGPSFTGSLSHQAH